jgi:hypothetical protein
MEEKGYNKRKLKEDAVPSQFQGLPGYLSKAPRQERPTTVASTSARWKRDADRLDEAIEVFFEQDQLHNVEELCSKKAELTLPEGSHLLRMDCGVLIFGLTRKGRCQVIGYSLEIHEDLSFLAALASVPVNKATFRHICEGEHLSTCSMVSNLVAFLKNKLEDDEQDAKDYEAVQHCIEVLSETNFEDTEVEKKVTFLQEQLSLAVTKKYGRRYSQDLLAASFMWNNTSPALFKQLKEEGFLSLPSQSHLRRLSQAFQTETGMSPSCTTYLQARADNLKEREKIVVLMVDEIFVSKRVEYASGKMYGTEDGDVCKTLLTFMVKSVAGRYTDVVALYPVTKLTGEKLKEDALRVLEALTDVGFEVLALIGDNATMNRRCFVDMCGGELKPFIPHPYQPGAPLFILFDSVHNFKNCFNNFKNRREFNYPCFEALETTRTAKYDDVEKLYNMEIGKPVKLAHKLTHKVLNPSAIEKTNVGLSERFFHESTINALIFYSEQSQDHVSMKDTAELLRIIRTVWNITNCKTPFLRIKKRNETMLPITKDNEQSVATLTKFVSWLEAWEERSTKEKKCLTRETFLAVKQTTLALMSIAKYLLEEKGFEYVLLGQIQTDDLEKRFGWYRQLLGANFFVSVRQIMEAEKSIRMRSLLRFSGYTLEAIQDTFEDAREEAETEVQDEADKLLKILDITKLETNVTKIEDQNIVFYVAGYCGYSVSKRLKCEECCNSLKADRDHPPLSFVPGEEDNGGQKKKFVEAINRGGLFFPSDQTFLVSLFSWTFYSQIQTNAIAKKTLYSNCQPRQVFLCSLITMLKNTMKTNRLLASKCQAGHTFGNMARQIISKMFNMFAKNECTEMNSITHSLKGSGVSRKSSAGRKVQKLQSS